jgi:DNA polymerase
MQIENLSIDIETFSSYDLSKVGVYKYVESPDFEILLFGVSINGGEVEVYDLKNGDTLPDYLVEALLSKDVIK